MNDKKKSTLLTLIGVLLATTPLVASYQLSINYKNDFIQSLEQSHIAIITDMQVGFKEFSLKHSTNIAHKIIADGLTNDQIQSFLKSEYKNLDDVGLDQIQVIDEEGYSIARVNDVQLIGLNLKHRPLIKKALETGVVEEWFESGLVRSGYRFIYPVVKDGNTKYLIEFVLSLKEIENRLKALHGNHINLYNPNQLNIDKNSFNHVLPIRDSDGNLYAFSILTPKEYQVYALSKKISNTQNVGILIFISLISFLWIQHRSLRINIRKISELKKERKIFDNGPVILFHWENALGWPVTYVSKTVQSILGYKEEFILSKDFIYSDIIHPDDKERIKNQVNSHINHGSDKYKQEYRIKKIDGSYIYVVDYTYVIRDESGEPIKFIGYLVDQSEYIDKDYQLLLSDIIINESNEVIVLADKDGNITFVNDTFYNLCQISKPRFLIDIFPDHDFSDSWTKEIEFVNATGKKYYLSASFSIIEKNENIRLLLTFRDISEIKEANERFTYITTHDSLTQAKNKFAIWFDMLSMVKKQKPFTVINIQINNLKKFVDIYGHLVGDAIIKKIYDKLHSYTKGKNLNIGRLEDRQFIVVFDGHNEAYHEKTINDLLALFSIPIIINDTSFSVKVSIGSVVFPDDFSMPDNIVYEETTNDIVRLVSIAVDTAFKEGKGYLPYDKSMLEAIQSKEEYIRKIDECINNKFNGLRMVYQPKYHCTGDVGSTDCQHLVGFEALLRCDFMPLFYLLSISEENGKILDIGRFVIERVISDVKDWIDDGFDLEGITISFNVSAIQLANQDVGRLITSALELNGVDGNYFEMEITESKIIENFDKVKSVVEEVKRLGAKVSIDDFGTGYSNLKSLLDMPVDTIKIDRSFVQNMDLSQSKQALIETIIGMASSMNATTIAEGVERAEEVEVLIRAGNRNFQGYYFDRPLEIDLVKERLANRLML